MSWLRAIYADDILVGLLLLSAPPVRECRLVPQLFLLVSLLG
eukprot:COSAG05_NODE_163_length_15471_cov_29.575072_7_plen_42_part_00